MVSVPRLGLMCKLFYSGLGMFGVGQHAFCVEAEMNPRDYDLDASGNPTVGEDGYKTSVVVSSMSQFVNDLLVCLNTQPTLVPEDQKTNILHFDILTWRRETDKVYVHIACDHVHPTLVPDDQKKDVIGRQKDLITDFAWGEWAWRSIYHAISGHTSLARALNTVISHGVQQTSAVIGAGAQAGVRGAQAISHLAQNPQLVADAARNTGTALVQGTSALAVATAQGVGNAANAARERANQLAESATHAATMRIAGGLSAEDLQQLLVERARQAQQATGGR